MSLRLPTILACCALCAIALPCVTVAPEGKNVLLSAEDVVIVWDKDHGVEHFIRKAIFTGDQKTFGFIVPTPTQPQLSEVDDAIFDTLDELTRPKPISLSCAEESDAGATMATKSIDVLAVQQVGKYTAAILKATDGKALTEWLTKNGYFARPSLTPWFESYAKKGWIFTALKFNGAASVDPKEKETDTEAIRLSFKTDRPHYPYSRPTDAWQVGIHQPMKVYFISSSPIAARYEKSNKDWEADVLYSGAIRDDAASTITDDLNLTRDDLPKHLYATVFDNTNSAGDYSQDLYFAPTYRIPWSMIAIAVAIFAALAYGWIRKSRKHKNPEPQQTAELRV